MTYHPSSIVRETGLSEAEAQRRRQEYGPNRLPAEKAASGFLLFFNQFRSPLILIILVAAGVSLTLKEYGDFAIILIVILADVILGFVQEYQAQRTYLALKQLLKPIASVLRDGIRRDIDITELTVGDLVYLSAGDKVPADGTLLEAVRLSVDESLLTGESEALVKSAADKGKAAQVFMGSTVLTGRGLFRIDKIAEATELGQIAQSLSTQKEPPTPFQIRLGLFSRQLTLIVIAFTVLIVTIGFFMGQDLWSILRIAIILAIAAVPEGLLIAVTVILVLGMRKILKRQGLVKRLLAVETLGSVTVICTDKTGTLTQGQMRIVREALEDREAGLKTMILCNNLEGPVDIALWQYAEAGLEPDPLIEAHPRLSEEPFTSESKCMITLNRDPQGQMTAYLKGAPEIVLAMCPDADSATILSQVDKWADEGLRLIGLARRFSNVIEHNGYTWVGLVALEDPLREDVIESIRKARQAGIDIKIITGDYRKTAERIAKNIGLSIRADSVLEQDEIVQLSEAQLRQRVNRTNLFVRIRPKDKFRIIDALAQNGAVTAMIGDGVNDAPALKRADIGVVVGSATEVAKETADLILLDSRFSTIVAAIEEGRIIFANVRKAIAYMLSNSFAEVLTIFMAMVLRWPTPLLVVQILWIHLICDGPSDIVLGFEPKEPGVMAEKPRPLSDPILTPLALSLIAFISFASAVFALNIFNHVFEVHQDVAAARSIVFASLAVNSMVYIFAYRSLKLPLIRMKQLGPNIPLLWAVGVGLFTIFIAFLIPGLRLTLGLVPLDLNDWILVFGFALVLMAVVEIAKIIAIRHVPHR